MEFERDNKQFESNELCACLDFINNFECFQQSQKHSLPLAKSYKDFTDGLHLQRILFFIDEIFFEEFFNQNNFEFESAESVGQMKSNLKIIVDSVKQYYSTKVGLDITSADVMQRLRQGILSIEKLKSVDDPLLFHDIDLLVQTEASFENGDCVAMMQLFIFVFALFLQDDSINEKFLEPIMQLEEDCQEYLQNIIQQSSELIERL